MKLLLVEDEARTARVLAQGLGAEGHDVDVCATGADALARGSASEHDVILLDWRLPDVDGVSVLKEWRARGVGTPVLLLTARGSTAEKVEALRAGADDYLVKPFAFDELLARLEALHRRGGTATPARLGALRLDPRRRALVHGVRSVSLTQREYQLLAELTARRGEPVARAELLRAVWGSGETNPNVVDVYVGYLRTKLERVQPAGGVAIESVRGVGYRLRAPPPESGA